jgi:hypothetical protein
VGSSDVDVTCSGGPAGPRYFREFSELSRDTNAFPTFLFDIVLSESNKGHTRKEAKLEDSLPFLMANIRTIYWFQRLVSRDGAVASVVSCCCPSISACPSADLPSTRRSAGEKKAPSRDFCELPFHRLNGRVPSCCRSHFHCLTPSFIH